MHKNFHNNYKLYTDIMSQNIGECAYVVFCGNNTDPEVLWSFFRKEMTKLKKEHCRRYQEYLSSDDETEYKLNDFDALKFLTQTSDD